MKFFLALVVLASVGLVGWYGYCVNPVMDRFQSAVDSGKPDAVLPFLDMAALKKNVGDFVKLRYSRPDNPAANLSPDAIQQIVDSYVTPANIILFMKGVEFQPGQNPPDLSGSAPKPLPIEMHYESPQVYAVDIYLSQVKTPDNRFSLLFARDGWFDWKLSALRFSWS